jgi:hypothetical protein
MGVFSTTDMEMLKNALDNMENDPVPSGLKHCKGCVYDGDCSYDVCNKLSLDEIKKEVES